MPYTEAKEHARGRLHVIFAEPYTAFDNEVLERQLHLDIALKALLQQPLATGRLRLQVIHGWENGSSEPDDLQHSDHIIASLDDLHEVANRYQQAITGLVPLPKDATSLLAKPRDIAIAKARDQGLDIDDETRDNPARWPVFEHGLYLYTFFKVYHRLTYGEDDSYRSVRCETPDGLREIHEFHLEEGEFAIVTPVETQDPGQTLLIVHEGELEPLLECLKTHLA
ncbi:hypothetical protein [Litchfieldella rifensis]|uniref:Uncharacterized protein n=1 Tax=Litchfieldella rifensis TaxID=762643 RepID=A0ABV7LUP2_9GAMM